MYYYRREQERHYPRDDYQELLKLSIIIHGGIPPNSISFRKPGAKYKTR